MQIVINNKPYQIHCGEGEEDKLLLAADGLNAKISEIKKIAHGASHEMLIVMAGLVLQDAFNELSSSGFGKETNEAIADALDSISGYVEKLSEGLK